jgi:hypothetical protein
MLYFTTMAASELPTAFQNEEITDLQSAFLQRQKGNKEQV